MLRRRPRALTASRSRCGSERRGRWWWCSRSVVRRERILRAYTTSRNPGACASTSSSMSCPRSLVRPRYPLVPARSRCSWSISVPRARARRRSPTSPTRTEEAARPGVSGRPVPHAAHPVAATRPVRSVNESTPTQVAAASGSCSIPAAPTPRAHSAGWCNRRGTSLPPHARAARQRSVFQ